MKRSKMLEILGDAILDNIQLGDVLGHTDVVSILDKLEEAGMLPPKIIKEGVIPGGLEVESVDILNKEVTFGESFGVYTANEWEPENEEK